MCSSDLGAEKIGSMFKFGCVTLVLELAVGYRHGVIGGLFDLDVLPMGGKVYISSLLFALVASAVKVANYSWRRNHSRRRNHKERSKEE